MFAPVVVFGYNRPNHLEKSLKAIEANPEAQQSDIYIFIDGPKPGGLNLENFRRCQLVANKTYRFRSKKVITRNSNYGLAKSIRSGLDYVFQKSSSVIVIEDDIILTSTALKFLNEGLTHYSGNSRISSIQSYQYPVGRTLTECVALRGADCWGWATWRDRWQAASFDGPALEKSIKDLNLVKDFDLDGAMNYTSMLNLQIQGKIDSWAICWHASMFLQERLCVYPPASLSSNIGADGTGIHSGIHDIFRTSLSKDSEWHFPDFNTESSYFRELLKAFYFEAKPKRNLLNRVLRRLNIVWTALKISTRQ